MGEAKTETKEYKKYSQYMMGQYKDGSKKAQALFIGRAIQDLTSSVIQHAKEKNLRLDTLRFAVSYNPLENGEGETVKGWTVIIVAYEVGSWDEFTEEDRKAMEEKKKQQEEARRRSEEETGMAAMEAMDRELGIIPPVQDLIQ